MHQSGVIENNLGKTIIQQEVTYNIYNNSPLIRHSLSKGFESLSNEPSIKKVEVITNNQTSGIEIPQEEFPLMAIETKAEVNEERIIEKQAVLNIFKVVFEKKYKWEFYYKGIKILANISDDAFFKKIDKGESFAKGDILKANIKIHQVFDESINTYVNKSYEIAKVVEHIPKTEQIKLSIEE